MTHGLDRPIRIGMVGSGFMAQLHSAAYQLLPTVYRDAVPRVELARIAGGSRVLQAARDYGWAESSDDWRKVTEADDIDLVDIVTPNDTHADLVTSAAAHGKTIVCEKPLARDADEARAMGEAVAAAGVLATVCFMYRTWPATQVAKAMIERGDLGRIHGFRGRFLHDHVTGARDPAAWRLDPARAGSGVVGDIGSHALDLARYLVGNVCEVFATTRSVLPAAAPVDDEADILLRFDNGAQGHVWLSWLATGTTMDVGFEVLGDHGSLRFTWQRPSELALYDARRPADVRGFTTIPLGPDHPSAAPLSAVAGIGLGYQEGFVTLLGGFLRDLATGTRTSPSFADGVVVSGLLDAVLESSRREAWMTTP